MNENEPYPLTLEPIPAEQFQDRSGRPWPAGEVPAGNFGTLWLATDISRVAAGPQAGRGLGYLRHLWGADLAGLNCGDDPGLPLPVELKLKNTGETAQTLALTEYSLWYALEKDSDFQAFEVGSDIDRGTEFRPEFEVGSCLWLPQGTPLFLAAGLILAQIGPPSRPLPTKPAEDPKAPHWLVPTEIGPEEAAVFQDQHLSVRLITTSQRGGLTAPEALTFIWPLAGQGRILTRGPAPTTRLSSGRAVLLPASLGRYSVESAGKITYMLIESR